MRHIDRGQVCYDPISRVCWSELDSLFLSASGVYMRISSSVCALIDWHEKTHYPTFRTNRFMIMIGATYKRMDFTSPQMSTTKQTLTHTQAQHANILIAPTSSSEYDESYWTCWTTCFRITFRLENFIVSLWIFCARASFDSSVCRPTDDKKFFNFYFGLAHLPCRKLIIIRMHLFKQMVVTRCDMWILKFRWWCAIPDNGSYGLADFTIFTVFKSIVCDREQFSDSFVRAKKIKIALSYPTVRLCKWMNGGSNRNHSKTRNFTVSIMCDSLAAIVVCVCVSVCNGKTMNEKHKMK